MRPGLRRPGGLQRIAQAPAQGGVAPGHAVVVNGNGNRFTAAYQVPYHPNVTMGWDSWPRVPAERPFEPGAYPATPLITANPPSEFRLALAKARAWLDRPEVAQKILTINAWNEWTEGSYLEPDEVHGMGYLQAIRDIFG